MSMDPAMLKLKKNVDAKKKQDRSLLLKYFLKKHAMAAAIKKTPIKQNACSSDITAYKIPAARLHASNLILSDGTTQK